MTQSEIHFERRGAAGVITLDRPKALNALTLDMCTAMRAVLRDWAADDAVRLVVVRSTGGRAFCAGGDVRFIYENGRARNPRAIEFFREEYLNNLAVKRFPKPYVALVDGLVMGGGAGISMHGSHRLGGENTLFAMPETGIGLFPDVGATHFLPRLRGERGTYLALTGARLRQADALWCGYLTHAVPASSFEPLIDGLADGGDVDAAIAAVSDPAPRPGLAMHEATIDRCFAADTVEEVLARLEAEEGEDRAWAAETAATLRSKSPTSLKLALRLARLGRRMAFDECMKTEFRVVTRVLAGHDFYEGTRAVVIDKDNEPAWRPASLAEVGGAEIDRHFAPLDGAELPVD